MRPLFSLLLLTLLASGSILPAQDFSEQQGIAVFRLSYYGQPSTRYDGEVELEIRGRRGSLTVTLRGTGQEQYDRLFASAFAGADERIRRVFVEMGRFRVIGMQQRLTADSLSEFIDLLSDAHLAQDELPQEVLLGQQAFTEADFRRLSGSYVLVVPSVSWYDLYLDDDDLYQAEIETSFSFIDVESGRTFEQFTVFATGSDREASQAVREAVDSIPYELSFRVREMERFRIKTGILEVRGQEALIEFGSNMGLVPGEEYAIVRDRVLPNGRIVSGETGLLVIKDVQQDVSFAQIRYAVPGARVGDQLREVPRRGVEGQFYLNTMTDGLAPVTYLVGFKGIVSRGFYRWRPFANVELPIRGLVGNVFLPLNVSVGGEANLHVGRITIAPNATIGLGGAVPIVDTDIYEPFYISHLGASARVSGSLLVSRDILLHVEVGYGYWVSLIAGPLADAGGPLSSYGGLIIGGGITIK